MAGQAVEKARDEAKRMISEAGDKVNDAVNYIVRGIFEKWQ